MASTVHPHVEDEAMPLDTEQEDPEIAREDSFGDDLKSKWNFTKS